MTHHPEVQAERPPPMGVVDLHETGSPSREVMELTRDRFVEDLVVAGSISSEYAQSGELNEFAINEETGSDALSHILVGDHRGGAHHMRTVDELDMGGSRVFASEIHDPDNPKKPLRRFRKSQRVHPNGTFRCNIVEIEDEGVVMKKLGGSTMFPQEWSAERVLKSVVNVSRGEPTRYDPERQSSVYEGSVDDVPIRLVKDHKTGKIITASVNRIQHG